MISPALKRLLDEERAAKAANRYQEESQEHERSRLKDEKAARERQERTARIRAEHRAMRHVDRGAVPEGDIESLVQAFVAPSIKASDGPGKRKRVPRLGSQESRCN